jgi:hypothetical protein
MNELGLARERLFLPEMRHQLGIVRDHRLFNLMAALVLPYATGLINTCNYFLMWVENLELEPAVLLSAFFIFIGRLVRFHLVARNKCRFPAMFLLFLSHVAKFRNLIIPLVLLVSTPENLADVDKLLTLTHEQLSFTLKRGIYSLELWLHLLVFR